MTFFLLYLCFLVCYSAFCPIDGTQVQDLQSGVPVIITGKVVANIKDAKCVNQKLLYNYFNQQSVGDSILVQLDCQVKGVVQCIQGLQSEGCFVAVHGTAIQQECEQGLRNQLAVGQVYTLFLTHTEQFDACQGIYSLAAITEQTKSYWKNKFGDCHPQPERVSLKNGRQLLQQSGENENSTLVQCGLFGVDISYCGSDGLVTDQQSAKVVLACNSQISGICSSCITVSGPADGSVSYVSDVDNSSTHFEIQVKWEDEGYEGQVQISTANCNLVTQQEGEAILPVTPMKFNSVPKVMVRPAAYRINSDL